MIMLENFNVTSLLLKRHVKISVYLPKNYNGSSEEYNSIFLLDGQNVFYDNYADDGVSMRLASSLDEIQANVIIFAIHSPKNNDWRLSEFIPFKTSNEKMDTTLSYKFVDFINDSLLPLLEYRYRLNNNKVIIGFNEGAISAAYIASHIDKFNYVGLFSPIVDLCHDDAIDLFSNIVQNKIVHLYYGGLDDKFVDVGYKIFQNLDKSNNQNVIFDYETNEENNMSSWKKHILSLISKM
jgi:predicted alpha/beta superfamily hydrolase